MSGSDGWSGCRGICIIARTRFTGHSDLLQSALRGFIERGGAGTMTIGFLRRANVFR